MQALLTLCEVEEAARATEPVPAEDEHLLCALPKAGKVLAQAANVYQPGAPVLAGVSTPWRLCKMTDRVQGPGEPIVVSEFASDVVEEIEGAIVTGRPGRQIDEGRAVQHIAGYTTFHDVSGRRLDLPAERRSRDFDGFIDGRNCKWMDGLAILGPAVITPEGMPALDSIDITTRVNEQVRVRGSARDIIHGLAQAVAFASRFPTLRPGDVIAAGMPHGPGPETFLKPGDGIEEEVAGLGVLRNAVVAERNCG